MTSNPFVRRTFATFRSAEFGFFGVVVYTRVQTPRRNGFAFSAGDFSFLETSRRLRRTSCLIVGMKSVALNAHHGDIGRGGEPRKLVRCQVSVNRTTYENTSRTAFSRYGFRTSGLFWYSAMLSGRQCRAVKLSVWPGTTPVCQRLRV